MSATASPVASVPKLPACGESSQDALLSDCSTMVVCKVQIGSTEVDLSDVFANSHEEVSAPLFTRVC